MALLEHLLAEIDDNDLRTKIESEVKSLKNRTEFGLVFERHIPESVVVASEGILRVGDEVRLRKQPTDRRRLRVRAIKGAKASVSEHDDGTVSAVAVKDLLVLKRFDAPFYPTVNSVAAITTDTSKPHHLVIDSENFHALRLLQLSHAGKADVIYIDPPYNTGARDWKYNNDYVDKNDSYRSSKWLSFMEKRLRIAKELLKADGVLVVTIDEHEIHHLGVLLEQIFPEYLRYTVTIVNSARGNFKANFSRVDEYAVFVCPDVGYDVITGAPVDYLGESGDTEEDAFEDDDGVEQVDEALADEGAEQEYELRHEDYVVEMPQSGERINGRDKMRAFQEAYPNPPSIRLRRVVVRDGLWVAEAVSDYGGRISHVVNIIELREGKIFRETRYYSDPFEAPAWRAQWVERLNL